MEDDLKVYAKELHKPVRRNFPRRFVTTRFVGDIWAADLVDMSNIKDDNDGVTFLLNIVDIYSRYAMSFPLKNKNADSILNCFKTLKRLPNNLWVDEGKEFYNKKFEDFCKEKGINIYHAFSGLKSVFVERFNRTLKEKMYQYFTEEQSDEYLDELPEFIKQYNKTPNSRTRVKPVDVWNGSETPYQQITFNNDEKPPKFKVGEFVRVSNVKKQFEKGYTARWSKEVFKVTAIDSNQDPVMYKLEDQNGEPIKGKFYEPELAKSELKDFAVIERIVDTKKNKKGEITQALVKWDGYSDDFNQWLPYKQVQTKMGKKNRS